MPDLWSCRVKLDPYNGGFALLPSGDSPPAAIVALMTAPSRQQIERLEEHLVQYEQVEMPPVHRFADGMYAREITIPADTLMTGKVHKAEHVSIMLSGDMTVLTEAGMQRIKGPKVFISPPGTKRVGYAHSETVWITVHTNPHNERDIDLIESVLVEPWNLSAVLQRAQERL
jgi:quercetin dioxygenase-like cupin family protein